MNYKMTSFILWICITFFSCHDNTQEQIEQMLAAAPVQKYQACGNATLAAYNLNYTDMIEEGDITWYVRNYPIGTKEKVINKTLGVMMDKYKVIIQKEFTQVFGRDSADADIIIEFKNIDGKNGQYGVCLPHYDSIRKKKYAVATIDIIDYLQRVNEKDFFFETAFHEVGHALGLGHSEYKFAVMWPWATKEKRCELSIDDIEGLRVKYNLKRDIEVNGKKYIFISKYGKRQLTKNFNEKEFLKKCHPRDGHYLAWACIEGAQVIRDLYGPCNVISSFRDKYCNDAIPGAKDSRHLYRDAIDLKLPPKIHRKFVHDIYSKKPILDALIKIGIRGFGSYPYKTFHIDARSVHFSEFLANGIPYMGWGDMVRPYSTSSDADEFKTHD